MSAAIAWFHHFFVSGIQDRTAIDKETILKARVIRNGGSAQRRGNCCWRPHPNEEGTLYSCRWHRPANRMIFSKNLFLPRGIDGCFKMKLLKNSFYFLEPLWLVDNLQ
jgi:hypothetical protein